MSLSVIEKVSYPRITESAETPHWEPKNFRADRYQNFSVIDVQLSDFVGSDSAYVQMNHANGSGLMVCNDICTLRQGQLCL